MAQLMLAFLLLGNTGLDVEWSEMAIHFYGPVDLATNEEARSGLEGALEVLLADIPLDADRSLGEAIGGSDDARNYFQTALSYPQVISTRYSTSGEVQNEYAIGLIGPFIEDLIPSPSRISSPREIEPGEEPQPSIPSTGFIIDARGTGFRPAIFPRILDPDGGIILEPGTTDRNILLESGYIHYSYSPREALQSRELGLNPLRIVAERSAGANSCDLVLSAEDAERITGSALNRQLLAECRIIVIIDRQ